jgi:hypothetical protein
MLEVLSWDHASHEAVVISGFGPRAQWLRNVLVTQAAEIEIGRERWRAAVRVLGPAEGAAVLADYERRNRLALPVLRRLLSRLAGVRYDGTEDARRTVAERLPLIAFSPDRSPGDRPADASGRARRGGEAGAPPRLRRRGWADGPRPRAVACRS